MTSDVPPIVLSGAIDCHWDLALFFVTSCGLILVGRMINPKLY